MAHEGRKDAQRLRLLLSIGRLHYKDGSSPAASRVLEAKPHVTAVAQTSGGYSCQMLRQCGSMLRVTKEPFDPPPST